MKSEYCPVPARYPTVRSLESWAGLYMRKAASSRKLPESCRSEVGALSGCEVISVRSGASSGSSKNSSLLRTGGETDRLLCGGPGPTIPAGPSTFGPGLLHERCLSRVIQRILLGFLILSRQIKMKPVSEITRALSAGLRNTPPSIKRASLPSYRRKPASRTSVD